MTLTISDVFEQEALKGGLATLNSGQLRFTTLDNGGGSEIALLIFSNPAFGVPSGNPAMASAGPINPDTSITAGALILGFDMRTTGGLTRINGTVRKGSGGDFNVSENQVPANATTVNCDALNVTLSLS